MELIRKLRKMHVCNSFIAWAEDHGGTFEELWRDCEGGDEMLWIASNCPHEHKEIVKASCECARLALPYAKGDTARITIEKVEAWLDGKATIEEVEAAAAAASVAYANTAYDAAYASAYAAVYAAYTAYDAAYAAASAVAATYAASAAYATAQKTTLKKCADIVRKHVKCPQL